MDVRTTEVKAKDYLVAIKGRFDTDNAYLVDSELNKIVPMADNITLDFDKVEYISSAGLRVILGVQKRMNKKVDIINANDVVYEIFEITGFIDVINVQKKEK